MTNILDNPERIEEPKEDFKSRVPRDLMIVLGVLLALFGLYFLYVFADSIDRLMSLYSRGNTYYFVRHLIARFLPLLYGFILIIAGVGLILKRVIGWIFGLSAVIFPILAISIGVVRTLLTNRLIWDGFALVLMIAALFFCLVTIFLLSNPIRNYFNPTKKHYGISAFVVIILMVYLFAIPLLTSY